MEPFSATPTQNLFADLQVDQTAQAQLKETAKWAKFLAIVGFVLCGLLVILAIFMASFMSRLGGGAMGGLAGGMGALVSVFYVAFAILYFFPCLNLFRFANKTQSALQSNSQEELNYGLGQLKSFFKFFGIMTIIVLSLYALIIIIGILAALMR